MVLTIKAFLTCFVLLKLMCVFWVMTGRKIVGFIRGLINKKPEDGIEKTSRNVVSFLHYYTAS